MNTPTLPTTEEILILDVTRMRQGRACLVGMKHDKQIVRPVFPHSAMLLEDLILSDGQPIRPGSVLTMKIHPKPGARPPHVEDHHWHEFEETRCVRMVEPVNWRMVLQRLSAPVLAEAFGTQLHAKRKIEPGTGICSTTTIHIKSLIKLHAGPNMYETPGEHVYRLDFSDQTDEAYFRIPITDLNFNAYADYHLNEQGMTYDQFTAHFRRAIRRSEIFLRIGLTRPFQKSDILDPWCWMQITGIHTIPDYLDGRCYLDFSH